MEMSTAILVIDMQNDFLAPNAPCHMEGCMDIVPQIQKLLKLGRERGWSVVHIVRGHDASGVDMEKFRMHLYLNGRGYAVRGTEGAEIIGALKPEDGDIVIEKVRFSGFFATKLDLVLRRLGIKNLVLCGTQYPNCVRSTAVDGISLDYNVYVCTDATWGASAEVTRANIFDMENMGIRCLPLEKLFMESGL